MNWKLWLKGLAAAAIGGAATGATHALSTSSGAISGETGMTTAAGALVTMLAYLVKSPLGGAPATDASPESVETPLAR